MLFIIFQNIKIIEQYTCLSLLVKNIFGVGEVGENINKNKGTKKLFSILYYQIMDNSVVVTQNNHHATCIIDKSFTQQQNTCHFK